MKKDKFHSFVAIIGLSLAFTCSFFVFAWFKYELSYDTFYKDSDRIFQLNAHQKDKKDVWLGTPYAISSKIKEFPEIEEYAIQKLVWAELPVSEENRPTVYVLEIYENFFSMFPQTFLARSSDQFGPADIVLTKDFALKHWGTLDILGKTVGRYTIKGIVETPPSNTTFFFEAIIPRTVDQETLGNWGRHYYSTFIRLAEGVEKTQFAEKFKKSVVSPNGVFYYDLVPLHLSKHMLNGRSFLEAFGFLIVISIVLFLLLLSAMFNFVMLSISRFLSRLRAYAIHKTMGATNMQLIGILYGEIILSLMCVLIITYILVELLQGSAVSFIELPMSSVFLLGEFIRFVIFCILIVCACSSYPVFYIRHLALKKMLIGGSIQGGKGRLDLWMVGLQLAVTIVFSFFILGMVHQFIFMTRGNLGYITKNVQRFAIESDELKRNIIPFMNELKSNSIIEDAIWCDYDLFGVGAYSAVEANAFLLHENFDINDKREIYYYPIMKDAFSFFELSLVKGRFWDGEDRDGINEVVVNETLVSEFGEKDIIGKIKSFKDIPVKVVGIVKDFHNKPMQEPIYPSVFVNSETNGKNWPNGGFWRGAGEPSVCYFKYDSNNRQKAIDFVSDIYAKYSNGHIPYVSSFEQYVSSYYKEEKKMLLMFLIVSVISLFISVMGLFALVSFKLYRRRKEIALRKIQGASTLQIMIVLIKEYAYLILVASFIGFPLVYLALDYWLMQYRYQVSIGFFHIIGVFIFMVLVVCLTIAGQVIKTTFMNPINVIKENN